MQAALALACWPLLANAQAFPEKPVQIVVPYGPAGLTDNIARYYAQQLKDVWPQPVVVENRPGAGASLGAAQVARATPDGHTLLLGSVGMATNPFLFKELPYKPSDLTPLALVALAPNVLYVHPSVPARNVKELVEYAKKNPGALSFASAGVGSSPHLAAELFAASAGIKILHIPYKGTGEAIKDFLSGEVKAYFDTMQSMRYARDGRIRALAVTTEKRLADVPDLPTVEESGVAPGVISSSWFGFYTQQKVSDARRTDLVNALQKVAATPAAQDKMRGFGLIPVFWGPKDFDKFMTEESRRWGGVIQSQKISLE
jgi:tripartite-type tricarboxylate transporter receptor subunit TctC